MVSVGVQGHQEPPNGAEQWAGNDASFSGNNPARGGGPGKYVYRRNRKKANDQSQLLSTNRRQTGILVDVHSGGSWRVDGWYSSLLASARMNTLLTTHSWFDCVANEFTNHLDTRKLPKRSHDPTIFMFLNLILRRETKWSLEGPMADTGSSFEAPLCIHIGCSRCGHSKCQTGEHPCLMRLRMRSLGLKLLNNWINSPQAAWFKSCCVMC